MERIVGSEVEMTVMFTWYHFGAFFIFGDCAGTVSRLFYMNIIPSALVMAGWRKPENTDIREIRGA